MQLAEQALPDRPQATVDDQVRILRAKLIFEEAMETIKALGVRLEYESYNLSPDFVDFHISGEMNIVEVVDGCCDVLVVTTGTLSALGVADDAVQRAVDDSNMKKFGPGGHKRESDGKWIKPQHWQPPAIEAILRQQGLE